MKLLLEKGAKLETKDNSSWTALLYTIEYAIENRYKDDNDSNETSYNTDNKDDKEDDNREVIVQLLLEKGANVNSKDKDSWTLLLYTTRKGHKALVKLLLERGAKLETKNNYSLTLLLYAT